MSKRASNAASAGGSVEKSARGEESFISVEEMQKLISDSITKAMPTVIIEASKVARAGIQADQESSKEITKQMKQLQQSQENLATVSKAASLKSDGRFLSSVF